jgi:hypothetical protein
MASSVVVVIKAALWPTLGLLSRVPLFDEKARVRHFVACACAQRLGRLVGLVAMAAIFRLHKIEVN